ncbi:GerMN domain-containing protein [Micromonospora sp. WMMD558]|uniref:GerMN domain-containing protein n=1 Tax=unclassified Micromonospora TaxID=2617518 RepID=UPI0012B4A260|nr:hypothetical protein [Micromonospora sp. WMMC415]QGN49937.1 hypothetical protein GKC29_26015 [Micromonospora sp. WMMC415]
MIRLRRRALLVALAVLVALAAGCGVRPSGVITGGPAPVGPARGTGLFFVSEQRLTLVLRPVPPPGSVDKALALLFAGPDPAEQKQGYTSEIPADVGLGSLSTPGGAGTTVTLTGGVTALSATAVDQIVCTVRYAAPESMPTAVTLAGPDGSRGPLTCAHPVVVPFER